MTLPLLSCLYRYKNALEVAQLGPDLKILPAGDLTEIGDRGVTLSGGQVRPLRAGFSNQQGVKYWVWCLIPLFILRAPGGMNSSLLGRTILGRRAC